MHPALRHGSPLLLGDGVLSRGPIAVGGEIGCAVSRSCLVEAMSGIVEFAIADGGTPLVDRATVAIPCPAGMRAGIRKGDGRFAHA